MKSLLYRFALWLAHKTAPAPLLIHALDADLMSAARRVIAAVEADVANASPENKHARAFAMLRRLAPAAAARPTIARTSTPTAAAPGPR